jgi:hypothetical protein
MNKFKKLLTKIKEYFRNKGASSEVGMTYKKTCNHDFDEYTGIKTHEECCEWKCKKCGCKYNGF